MPPTIGGLPAAPRRHGGAAPSHALVSFVASEAPAAAAGHDSAQHFVLGAYGWLGFDLDHAIARYRVWPLMRLVHDCLVTALVGFGVDATVFTPFDAAAVHKGLVCDFATGDVLLLRADGTVAAASHGGAHLSAREVEARYPPRTPWRGTAQLREQARHESFFVLLTYFDMPCVGVLDALVTAADAAHADAAAGRAVPPGRALLQVDAAPSGGALPLPYAPLRALMVRAFDVLFDNVLSFESACVGERRGGVPVRDDE